MANNTQALTDLIRGNLSVTNWPVLIGLLLQEGAIVGQVIQDARGGLNFQQILARYGPQEAAIVEQVLAALGLMPATAAARDAAATDQLSTSFYVLLVLDAGTTGESYTVIGPLPEAMADQLATLMAGVPTAAAVARWNGYLALQSYKGTVNGTKPLARP